MKAEEVDYLPCSIYFNPNLRVDGYDCTHSTGRTHLALDLGVDPFLLVNLTFSADPRVTISNRVEDIPGEDYPILWQAWDTPDGPLTQAIRRAGVCADWDTIHWGDESTGAIFKPLLTEPGDIDRCRHLIQPITEEDYESWLENNADVFSLARAHDLPVILTYGQGLAAIMFMMGAENAVYLAIDDPDGFEQLAEIIHQAEMRNIELAAGGHIQILKRFGGYEMCNFYNPEIFKKVCLPRLKAEVDYAHSLGLLIYYRVVTGMEPILSEIAGIGFDCIEGGEPHLSHCSLEAWHAAICGRASTWTGVSTPVLLGGQDPERVRREVRHCADIFGKIGFILGATNSIRAHFPWENTLAMIDEWKKIR
jgi:hypothetical protein